MVMCSYSTSTVLRNTNTEGSHWNRTIEDTRTGTSVKVVVKVVVLGRRVRVVSRVSCWRLKCEVQYLCYAALGGAGVGGAGVCGTMVQGMLRTGSVLNSVCVVQIFSSSPSQSKILEAVEFLDFALDGDAPAQEMAVCLEELHLVEASVDVERGELPPQSRTAVLRRKMIRELLQLALDRAPVSLAVVDMSTVFCDELNLVIDPGDTVAHCLELVVRPRTVGGDGRVFSSDEADEWYDVGGSL